MSAVQYQTVKKFLFFPLTLEGKTLWLVKAKILQQKLEYVDSWTHAEGQLSQEGYYWKNIRFIDNETPGIPCVA